ncbi:MAG TPA: flagellar basal body P-ring formation chaperone FlgA [Buchnera sp. (in: enterobacteria)]|nr:flagellar basal body P-ring formation chaperone FlgA [Buchnera sp. (in: enterobacteria)]
MKNILFFVFFFSFFLCDVQAKIDSKKNDSHINFCEKKNNFYKKIISFFKKRNVLNNNPTSVKIKNFSRIRNFCNFPKVILYPNSPILGNITARVFCNNTYQNIFVKVSSKGRYIVSNSRIRLGKKISKSDLTTKLGKLEDLPSDVCFKNDQVLDKISSKNISIGEPITLSMVRKSWKVYFNQSVSVIFLGENFIIITKGKALKNAHEKDIINVSIGTNSSKIIIEGVVNDAGEVVFLRDI